MKDSTTTQKLLMAVALLAAMAFAVMMAYPAGSTATAAPAAPSGMMTPF